MNDHSRRPPGFLWGSGRVILCLCVGGSALIPYAVESSTPALIRPGVPPAHLPPQGKAIGKPCVAYVENYRSKNPNVA